jgi:hypothetical protein
MEEYLALLFYSLLQELSPSPFSQVRLQIKIQHLGAFL